RIHKRFNVLIPLPELFKNPTIEGLSGYIRAAVNKYPTHRDQTEETLAGIWRDVLMRGRDETDELEPIGIHDDFFDIGGNSLRAILMISRIHKRFNVLISLPQLFKNPTIESLSGYIKATSNQRFAPVNAVEKRDYYPASSAQRRLYILQQMDPGNRFYNMPGIIPLTETPDMKKLETTLIQLIQRHESLRTSFHMIGEDLVQQVHDHVDFEIEDFGRGGSLCPPLHGNHSGILNDNKSRIHGEGNHREQGSHRELPLQAIRDFARPFDLMNAPLLRVGLAETDPGKHILMVDMHHIISDGISRRLLAADFEAIDRGDTLEPLKLQYKDFSQWQNSPIRKENIKKQETYWLEEFQDQIPVLELPLDYPRPVVQSFEGDTLGSELDVRHTQLLKQLAQENGATLYMVLAAVCNVLLSKLGNTRDIVIGTVVAGRRSIDLDKVFGMFVNTLPLRNAPEDRKTFNQFLLQLKEKTLSAFENQEYPFEDLVENLPVNRDTGRNPLFDVMFTLNNTATGADASRPAFSLSHEEYEDNISKFDLAVTAVESEDVVLLWFQYCTLLFKEETVRRFIDYFKRIAAIVVETPGIKLSDIEIISPQEKHRLLFDFNDTARDYPKDKAIHELFEEQARRTPDKIAVAGGGLLEYLTYRELNQSSRRLAYQLKKSGVTRSDIVGLMPQRSPSMITGLLAILKSGGAYLPIDPQLPGERIAYMMADSKAKILLSSVSRDRSRYPVPCIDIDNHTLHGEDEGHIDLSPESTPHDPLYVIYTSGSTGRPKGVVIENRPMVNFIRGITDHISFTPTDTILSLTTISFDIFGLEVLLPLTLGTKVIIGSGEEQADPFAAASAIQKGNVSLLQLTPSHLQMLTAHPKTAAGLRTLTCLLVGGEAFPLPLLEKVRTIISGKIFNLYGPTETTIWSTLKDLTRDVPLNIGRPISNTQVYIISRYHSLQPIGVAGELCIAGDGLARGYLNRVELTAERFINSKFQIPNKTSPFSTSSAPSAVNIKLYKTGDLARWLEDGNIEFIGRIDHQVKIRGFRIEPGEIRNRLLTHEQVTDAVVTAPQDQHETYLCAHVVFKGEPAGEAPLKEYLALQLPDYMIPRHIIPLERIPVTVSGKTDSRSLPAPGITGKTHEDPAPRTPIEDTLANLWQEVLYRPDIGLDDDFFRLGGHSLKAARLTAKIHKTFNVVIPLAQVFRHPTIRKLALYIAAASRENHRPLEPVEQKEYYPMTSAQKRLYFLQRMEPQSTAYNMPDVVSLEGEPTPAGLEQVSRKLVHRHESLRTSFFVQDNQPVQKVHDAVELEIKHYDLAVNRANGHENFVRPFDLSQAPLLRVGLMKDENNTPCLLIDIHHIVSDGLSMELLVRDFKALYSNVGENLPPLKLQYKDFSEWQNSETIQEAIRHQEQYWLDQFSGHTPTLNLPRHHAAQDNANPGSGCLNFRIHDEKTRRLRTLAKEENITLFMVLFGVFNVLLAKISLQEDIVVGTDAAGRRDGDLQKFVGMLVNTLAIRNRPRKEETFQAFLKDVKKTTIDAFENQDYPFEELVDKIAGPQTPGHHSRNPLFDVMFSYMNAAPETVAFLKQNATRPGKDNLNYENKTAKFDLLFGMVDSGDTLTGSIEFDAASFTEDRILMYIKLFEEILNALMENRTVKLKDIPIATGLMEAEIEPVSIDFGF
ncbi:MAG: amino acid adenylation domain-containing protein, partial [bacterium]|nr:amino acid adenylation domain-containing protein [bacterium]